MKESTGGWGNLLFVAHGISIRISEYLQIIQSIMLYTFARRGQKAIFSERSFINLV